MNSFTRFLFPSLTILVYFYTCIIITGKVKKVFMISQVLEYYKYCIIALKEKPPDVDAKFPSMNLETTFQEYRANQDDVNLVVAQMKAANIEPWMSGLACGRKEDCVFDIDIILSIPINSSLDNIPKSANDCPPNCGCDNPWAFLS